MKSKPHFMLSRRAAYLATHGFLYAFYGIGLAVFGEPRPSMTVLLAMLPFIGWGVVWCGVGIIAFIAATTSILDKWAYTALSGLAAGWAIGLLTGAILTGTTRGIILFLIFATFSISHTIVAGVPNSVHLPDSDGFQE